MNINEIESKEELLDLLNKGIDKFGITKKDINEKYASSSIANTKKKDKVRIRLLSQNEAVLKMMIPWGNRQNQTTTYGYPYKISEGKYGFEVYINDYSYPDNYHFTLINKINNIANNLYVFSYNYGGVNTKAIGFTTTRYYGIKYYSDRYYDNGYGISFQDNFQDKIENRVMVNNPRAYNGDPYAPIYSNSGHVALRYDITNKEMTNRCGDVKTPKTSTAPYAGLWPVINI